MKSNDENDTIQRYYYGLACIRYFSDALGVLEIIYKPLPEYTMLVHLVGDNLKARDKDDKSRPR